MQDLEALDAALHAIRMHHLLRCRHPGSLGRDVLAALAIGMLITLRMLRLYGMTMNFIAVCCPQPQMRI